MPLRLRRGSAQDGSTISLFYILALISLVGVGILLYFVPPLQSSIIEATKEAIDSNIIYGGLVIIPLSINMLMIIKEHNGEWALEFIEYVGKAIGEIGVLTTAYLFLSRLFLQWNYNMMFYVDFSPSELIIMGVVMISLVIFFGTKIGNDVKQLIKTVPEEEEVQDPTPI